MKVAHLPEPELEFGDSGRHVDVRFGLMEFGPLDRGTVRAPVNIKVGIVGTNETVEGISRWLESCQRGISASASRQPNLFPHFPGFSKDSAFGVDLVLDGQFQGIIPRRSIVEALPQVGAFNRVEEAVGLFIEECAHLAEKVKPDVLICAPPADLLDALEENISTFSDVGVESDNDEGGEGFKNVRQPTFHDILKARGMVLPVPIQMVRPETYDQRKRRRQARRPERMRGLQDEATRAWNFHTALYYKAGGTPWRIARESDEYTTCYVGVSFYRSPDQQRMMTSVAQVFNARGDGVIVRGGLAKFEKDDRQIHLEESDAEQLIVEALKTYRREHKTAPARVVVHKSSVYNAAELAGFHSGAASERIDSVDLLSIRRSSTRLFRFGYYPPLRGTMLSLDDNLFILYLKGSVDFFSTWPGMYVPRPIQVRRDDAEQTGLFLADELLALSKQNWNNTQFDGGLPITLRAAGDVGAILKHVGDQESIQARYSFYM
ncbi:MAG TPA: Piwi domain-containing protein [Nitrolancea sp.]|jgi:hypothetical protein|nr:Piwi domain-containing protein [Nitrolancea sp.]